MPARPWRGWRGIPPTPSPPRWAGSWRCESLGSIKGGEPLSRVTTSSLDALTRCSQGLKAQEAGDDERALALFEEARAVARRFAARYPSHPARFDLRARADFWTGAYERADSLVGRALEELEGRDRMIALVMAAGVDGIRGRLGEARRHLRVALDLAASRGWSAAESRLPRDGEDVESGDPYLILAEEYALLGASDRAEGLFRRYRGELPEGPGTAEGERVVAIQKALNLSARERHREALADLRRMRRTDPDCHDRCGLRQMGRLHERAGHPDSATVYYQRTLEEERRNYGFFLPYGFFYPYGLECLGELNEELGRREEARRRYLEFAELWADADPVLRARAR